MRNLTIKREKRFVACLMKMQVYIADPAAYQMVINGVNCRKLGDLKNGEEKTFQISDDATRIYVIADSLSKNFCNEYYDIPAGEDDVYLTGRNKYNPANGNAFRFDGNDTNPEVVQNRKKGTRKGLIVLVIALAIGVTVGFLSGLGAFWDSKVEPKTFSDEGMSITLTDEFMEVDLDGYNTCYSTEDVGVLVTKDEFSSVEGFEDYTLNEYAELLIDGYSLSAELKTKEGLTYFQYSSTNSENGKIYHYNAFVYRSDDAFWLVQFFSVDGDGSEYEQEFFEWAESVKFY